MLIYDLGSRNGKPIYEFLYESIREDILAGKIKEGEKLPSKREMAKNLGTAVITIENAYAQLQVEGYIISREKRGYFVNKGIGEYNRKESGSQDSKKTKFSFLQDEFEYAELGHKKSKYQDLENQKLENQKLKNQNSEKKEEYYLDFDSNHVVGDSFPAATWSKLMRKVLLDRQEDFNIKPDSTGVPELKKAISNYLLKAKGLNINPGQIIVGPGTEYLHQIILQLMGHNYFVAVEDPGYKKVGQIYESNGLRCLHIPVDDDGIIVDRLIGNNIRLVHISPSHHFPTGCTMPIERRHRILEWATKEDAYIIEDDYDGEFRLSGRPIPTLASIDGTHVIYMNTFTKTLSPSIRMAYMVLPEPLMEMYRKKLYFYSGTVSSFDQYTMAEFINGGYYERHINRMKNYYRNQREKILKIILNSEIKDCISIEKENAGLHFILKINRDIDDDEFVESLKKKNIKISLLKKYCYNKAGKYEHKFIMYYGDIPEEKLEYCLRVMKEALA